MENNPRRLAVVGAGLTGLVAAYRLARAGWKIVIFERYPEPGGLVATFTVGGERLECFYHHLFTTDTDYVALATELGLGEALEWLPSRMGIYSAGRMWDFGTPSSLLTFSPLGVIGRLRFAMSTLRLRHSDDLAEFEKFTAHDWIVRHAGQRVWDTVWGPLMRQKFAERAEAVSMAWLWRKVYLRGRSRSAGGLGELLGTMRGSFGRLVDRLVERLGELGVEIRLATPVRRIERDRETLAVVTRQARDTFDTVLFTASPQELAAVAENALTEPYAGRLTALESTGALCLVLELSEALTPYYWLNIADESFPFGGVIEHTNYVPPERYSGRHVVYISKYLLADHPRWHARDDEIWDEYRPWLKRLAPHFVDAHVLRRQVFRAAYAQPVIPPHYSQLLPPFETPVPGLFHACMAQVYPEDRGQNYAVRSGERAARTLLSRHS